MSRRALTLVLALGLAGTGALTSPAAAADQTQVLDLTQVDTDRAPGGRWSPAPIRTGAPALHLAIDAADADVCELTPDQASVDFTHVGTCHVTAYAPAYTGYTQSPDEPVTFDVAGHPTEATLTAAPPTLDVGDEITLTAVVSAGTGQPTGEVEFRRGGTLVATEPLEGDDPADDFATAVASFDAPESGTLSYVATYVPGDPTVWAGDVSNTASVAASRRGVTVTANPSAAAVAEDAPLTLAVTAKNGSTEVDPAVAPATVGTVSVDGDPVPVSWAKGTTTVTLPTDEVGHHEVSVSFQPDNQVTYAVPSAVTASYDVGAVTTTSLEVVPVDPLVGDEVLLTATVDSGGLDAPAGDIEFLRKGSGGSYVVLGTPVALLEDTDDPEGDTATAELPVEAENATGRLYAARYVPDAPAVLAASTSGDQSVTPVRRSVDVAVDVPTTPVLLGNDVTVAITATHGTTKTPVRGAPTTTVTIDGTPATGLDWTTGTDTVVLDKPTAGTHTVVVTYRPHDTDRYDTPTAVTRHFDITIPTRTTLSTAPTGVLVGDPATFTATVTTDGHGNPLGTLQLLRTESPGVYTKVDEQTPTLTTGSTDTATTTLTATPTNATPTDYRVRFVPTDPTDFHTSDSLDRTLTAVRRTVDVRVTVPTVDVATNAPVTVTVAATHGAGATVVEADDASSTVTFDGVTVPDIEWEDGAASFQVTPTTTGTRTVRVTFVPADADRYASPAAVTRTFVAKHAQPIRWGADDVAPPASVVVDGTWDSKVLGGASGNPVTLSPLTPTVCTVEGTVVTMLAAAGSTCRVRATQPGGSTYLPGSRDADIDVAPRPVSVRVSWPASGATYLKEVVVTATALDTTSNAPVPDLGPGSAASQRSGNGTIVVDGVPHPVVYTNGVATLPITPDDVDDIALSATFVPNRAYAYAPVSAAARVLPVGKADQQALKERVSAPAAPNIGDTWQPDVISGGSSEDVIVDTTTPEQCTVDDAPAGDTHGPIVTFDELDVCIVRFRQPGGRNYNDATPKLVPVRVVKLGVEVAITGQDVVRAYGADVTLRFAATATKSPHGAVRGLTTVTVTDRTTHADVPVTDLLTVDEATGTAVLRLGDELLAGTYDVRADFKATRDDLYSTTFTTDDFTLTLAEQTVSLEPGTSAPTAVRVGSDAWEPDFAETDAGTDVVLTRLDARSLAEPQEEYEDLPGWNPPTWSCELTDPDDAAVDLAVAFVSQGDCVLRAYAPGTARMYDDSDPVDYTIEVTRVPVSLSLVATPDEDVLVGDEVRVKATAKVGDQAASGHGPLTVTGETTLPDPAQAWFGGGRFHSFSPAHAGSYVIETWFHPADPVTYQNVKKKLTVEVEKGAQVPTLVGEQPTDVLVGDSWTPETVGGGSANPVLVEVDRTATDLRPTTDPTDPADPADPADYVCRVVDGEVLFVGHGECQLTLTQEGNLDYEEGDEALEVIEISRTTTTVTLVAPTDPQVGVPYTVAARVVGGAAATPVVGGGPIVVTIAGVEVAAVDEAWPDGVRSLTFVPDRVGPLVATATFTADDEAAYAGDADELTGTVVAGTQLVRIGLEPPTTAYVDGTWSPRVTGRGAPDAVPSLTSTTTSVCSVVGDSVVFRTAGSCSVTVAMAAVTAYGHTTWTGDAQTRTFTVHGHPTTVVVTQPEPTQRLVARPIDVRAQVSGRNSGAGTPVNVPGTVQFTVDDLPLGEPVDVSSTGLAVARITVPADGAVRTTRTYRFGAVFVPTDARYWARGDAPQLPVPIELNPQEIGYDAATSPLYIGQTWTPQVRISPAEALAPQIVRDPDDADICTYRAGVVFLDAVAADDSTCNLDYTQPGNGEWAAASPQGQGIEVQRRPVAVTLTVGTERTITRPVALSATVLAEAVAGTSVPRTTGLDAVAPAGSIRFAAGGSTLAVVPVVLDPDDETKPGTAATTYLPSRSGDVEVTATFEPSEDELFAGRSDAETVMVAKAPTTTSITAVTSSRLTALIDPQVEPGSPLGGSVAFSYTVVGSNAAAEPLGTVGVRDDRRAVLTGSVPPADQDVVIRADYLGDTEYAASRGLRDRHLPLVTPHVDGKRTGWNGGPVTVRFTCEPHPLSGGAIVSCPDPVTLRGDGRGQSVSRAGTAADGGRATATVSGLDIDDTLPTVRIGGTAAGASYRGSAPAATCLGSDALSGLASCQVTRTQLAGRAVRDTAVATDKAGNRATTQITYEVRQEWVVDAPLVRGGYQVRPGTTQRIIARTEGGQPQLMLPGAKGVLAPAKVFSAARIDNGIVTWFVDLKVPKGLRPGQRYQLGFRLSDAPSTIIRMRLDVVKKPAGKKPSGKKHRRR